ncbi:P-type ATPase superfamily [Thecamonas trahens ATCC 50062]|uniref:P-type ATPase superfamily n=1 Tax=Thecamonas trahens ATCC 50062 TaxID=461836 RepID=A0A0L0DKD0_THETB|nr:P-type ATPase superfamily [Thecamonas trahens ATCC 50062]KNC52742.1 P-type ATPase superfamily [Thecamonas trahens ATCC 50062]|eukprot:XP_013755056.1 P-type ATPase superfamily [Thecamonas trahens ATCC 50062]
MEWTGPDIARLRLYREKPRIGGTHAARARNGAGCGVDAGIHGAGDSHCVPAATGLPILHLPFVALYAGVLYYMYTTIGAPYEDALAAGAVFNPARPRPCRELPWEYMPSFVSRLALGFACFLHALTLFATRWNMGVRCALFYSSLANSADALEDATAVRVDPHKHKGKPELVQLEWMELSSPSELSFLMPDRSTSRVAGKLPAYDDEVDGEPVTLPFFVFQEIKYVYHPDAELWLRVECPVDAPLESYISAEGLHLADAGDARSMFGPNLYEIPMPTFGELYKDQLLSPFTVFQFFCVLLWCLDDYWKYSLFTLAMLLVFEATVSFSRLKSLSTLRAMNNAPRAILAFHSGKWVPVDSTELLPGDIISIRRNAVAATTMSTLEDRASSSATSAGASDQPQSSDNTIPCDCLLLSGSVVVNEANLTGESVPQLKEGVAATEVAPHVALDINGEHKVHMVFGGTTLLQHTGTGASSSGDTDKLSPPDGGAAAYVLRTGFSSSQGKLVRMIQFGAEKVTAGAGEVLLLMGFLLVFAIISSGYVLYKGMYDDDRDQFDLLLHCILIVTSVIPPDLNMQLAMAVNSSLMTLMKAAIFCTEPFRIPLAGKVNVALFDKTGTITTDKLVADAVVARNGPPVKPSDAPRSARVVLAGCHSLVQVNGIVLGDPLEEEALKAVSASYDAQTNIAALNSSSSSPTVRILHRHHFASKLQRMSVLAAVKQSPTASAELWALVKGSPEAVAKLLAPTSGLSSWYNATYQRLAKDGKRVLALAHKVVSGPRGDAAVATAAEQLFEGSRSSIESDLVFDGFIVFSCAVRADSRDVVAELREAAHDVVMITGDALFTAVHVARTVNILDSDRPALVCQPASDGSGGLVWANPIEAADGVGEIEPVALASADALAAQFSKLAVGADLAITGASLAELVEAVPDGAAWPAMVYFKVFARMTPELKEKVLAALKDSGHFTLMCGDGANDVGALKQAHVGLALLSGFGNANAASEDDVDADAASGDKPTSSKPKGKSKGKGKGKGKAVAKPELTPAEIAAKKAEAAKAKQAEYAAKMAEVEANIRARSEAGESMATVKEWWAFIQRETASAKAKASARKPKTFAESAALLAAQDDLSEGGGGEIPMVKLGDASIASPFTSKKPSIRGAVDVIRQGRCTLVTTLQMYQILALSCLISSYSLSVLYLDGIKYGDTQMTATGLLMTISYFAISMAKPLPRLSDVRPLTSIFHPALFLSLLAQFAVHLGTMVYAVSLTKALLPADTVLSIDGDFEPNLINTVVFLISSVQNVCVFAVNFKGRPFMYGITENRALMWSLGLVVLGAFVCAFEVSPMFNEALQLVAFPDGAFRSTIVLLLLVDVAGTFVLDRLLLAIFAPAIFKSSLKDIDGPTVARVVRNLLGLGAFLYFLVIPATLADPEALENGELEW